MTADITRSDIEAKLREIKGEVDTTRRRVAVPVILVGSVLVVGTVGLAYIMGRRRGRKTTTVVEVRRV